MSFAGKNDTLSATLDQMIYHTNAVCQGAPNTFVITDMPFGTYTDDTSALINAIRVYQETNADAIKIEGGSEKAPLVHHLTQNGIAVCGHIGLLLKIMKKHTSKDSSMPSSMIWTWFNIKPMARYTS